MINTKRLRCFIGWLAVLLPWIVSAVLWDIPPSISATYYTKACPVFMIVLGAASILLMFYDGYDIIDDVVNTAAGVFGIAICLFPCYTDIAPAVGVFSVDTSISSMIHNVSAAAFFGILAFVSLFQFTKTDGHMTEKKKKRNVIYRVCGVGMVGAFSLFLLPDFQSKVWIIEMIALTFFGVSWLTKANAYKWLFAEE